MKIALVGKGGSGKSSVSWLLIQWLISSGQEVLAIDADHNQNLSESLGYIVNENTPTIHHSHDRFMKAVSQTEDKKWSSIVLDNRPLPSFSLSNPDEYTKSLLIPLKENLNLIVGGLGSLDIIESGKCAHGNISPLKYYLPLLNTDGHIAVIDGVAGVDMLNFGLFAGIDVLAIVEEDHMHSKKVSEQIKAVALRFSIPFLIIKNKDNSGITLDDGIKELKFEKVSDKNKDNIKEVFEKIKSIIEEKNKTKKENLERLKNFEFARTGHIT